MLKKIGKWLLFGKPNDIPGDQRVLDLSDFGKLSLMVSSTK